MRGFLLPGSPKRTMQTQNPDTATPDAARDRVRIFDTTLRDGEQAPGYSMSRAQKRRLAQALAELGVDIIEAGFAQASDEDFAAVHAIAGDLSRLRRKAHRSPDRLRVRQWQELFFAERYSEVDLSDNPDFAVLARAFGIPAFTVDRADQVPDAIERLLAEDGPLFCHVKIDPRANVWPLVPPGKSNAQMMGCAA